MQMKIARNSALTLLLAASGLGADADAAELNTTHEVQKVAPTLRQIKPATPAGSDGGITAPAVAPKTNLKLPANLRVKAQLPPTAPSQPGLLHWRWTVENVGGTDAPASTLTITCQPIKGICPYNVAGTYPVPPLAKSVGRYVIDKEASYRKGMKPVQEGSRTTVEIKFTATVDSGGVVAEMNEQDNVSVATWKSVVDLTPRKNVLAAKKMKPNLAAQVQKSPFAPNPDLTVALEAGKSFAAGQSVWVLVKNVGDRVAKTGELEVKCHYADPNLGDADYLCQDITGGKVSVQFANPKISLQLIYLGTISLDAIEPGSFVAPVLLKPVAAKGPYRIEFKVSVSHWEIEKSLTNNTLVVTHP